LGWELAGSNVSRLGLDVLEGKLFPQDLSDAFSIYLIPKIDNPYMVS